MASLSGVTIVVEAARRSGSLITAELALAAGRDVGAVPGPVTSAVSAGCLDLIRSGASLIRDGFDVLETLTPGVTRPGSRSRQPAGRLDRKVLEAIQRGASSADLVAAATGIEIGMAMVSITGLEFDGFIEVDVSGRLAPSSSAFGIDPEAVGAATDYPASGELAGGKEEG